MSAAATVMFLVTILLVWGGLVASVVLLRTLPVPGGEAEVPAQPVDPKGLDNKRMMKP